MQRSNSPQKISATQYLNQYQNLICKIAWSYQKTTGTPFEDLLSEAYLGFMNACNSYNPEKGVFTTHAWYCIRNVLNDLLRNSRRWVSHTPNNPTTENNPELLFLCKETICEELKEDAQNIVSILFSIPDEKKPENKTELKKELRNKGMSWPKIWRGMKELREFNLNI